MALPVAHLDLESRSTCDLKTSGLYKYWEDPETEVLVVRWRIGDGPVNESPSINDFQLEAHIIDGLTVTGHNIAFDREGWNTKIASTYGFPKIPIEQTDCTQARCAALSLPQGLEQAGKVLNLSIQKDVEGHRLMMRMCKPKKHNDDGSVEWHETPEQLARLSEYCATDVLSECAIDAAVPQLSPSEKRLWVLDQQINARGVRLDVPLIGRALAVAERAALSASAEIYDLTSGAVERTSQTARIVAWLNARGIPAGSIGKGETEELLVRADLFDDPLARQVIELRSASAKSSVAKYKAMLRAVCRDGRSRGTLNYHGASTGRWAGRLWQPQNLPKINDAAPLVEELHEILSHNDADTAFALCRLNFDNPLDVLSKALRSMVIAEAGHVLIGGDYSNIEGRVNAWLAGEHWKTKAFFAFDRGEGPDLYKITYARAFGITPEEVTKEQRNTTGKTMDLAFSFAGGVKAYHKFGAKFGVSVSDERADEFKLAWREAHPAIKAGWYELQKAALEAVRHPGMKVPCLDGKIVYMVKRNILWCRLPSGRPLAYIAPHIESGTCKECHGEGAIEHESGLVEDCPECWGTGEIKARVAFFGMNSATKQWRKNALWHGLAWENVVQAIARDILVEGMFRLEEAGYPLVLTVHDENICEVPEGFGSPEELAELMSIVPTWAEGLPVAVSAWKDRRYVK